jgi:hypothetical protein
MQQFVVKARNRFRPFKLLVLRRPGTPRLEAMP